MRPLTLHASALSDVEYDIYTSNLNDIADEPSDSSTVHDDAHYEQMIIGLREARAWLRGRFSHIPASSIDAILKFFSPSLGANDFLSGGQFFAALRLAVHADNGKQLDRSLAFVQAHHLSNVSLVNSSQPPPPSKSAEPAPSTSTHTTANNPFTALTTPDNNSAHNSQAPPQHPMLRTDPFKSQPPPHNPFTQKPHDPNTNKSPPLPPRKPPPPVPPSIRHATPQVSVKRSTSPIHQGTSAMLLAGAAPAPPPPKPVSHVTSTLIKQSLHASKVAQSLKKAEEQLEKERIMQVLKSSSGGAGAVRNRSSSPDKGYGHIMAVSSSSRSNSDDRAAPPLPKRRGEHVQNSVPGRSQNPSPPQSSSSFDQIAMAGLSPRHKPSTTLAGSVKSDAHSGLIERGRSQSHPPSTSERARSEHSYTTQSVAGMDSHPGSVAASATSSPARLTTVLPPIPPPTHPDRRERDERDRDKRYGSVPVYSSKLGKSNQTAREGGRITMLLRPAPTPTPTLAQTQGQPLSGHVDTRSFDSVYGALVSPINTGDIREDGCTTAAPSSYATPTELVQSPAPLPPLITALPKGITGPLTPVSPDSPTPTTTKPPPSPTARVFRSKSMYQPSTPPPVPLPLRRRRRPESVQVLSASADSAPSASADSGGTMFHELVTRFEGGNVGAVGVDEGDDVDGRGTKMLSRHLSLSSPGLGTFASSSFKGGTSSHGGPVPNSPRGSSVLRRSSLSHTSTAVSAPPASGAAHHSHGHHHSIHAHNLHNGTVLDSAEHPSLGALQRTFASLQPKLDKARYKAEAGISRRGFIQGDGEGPDSGGESGGEREGLVRHHHSSRRRRPGDGSLVRNGGLGSGRVTPEEQEWSATPLRVEQDVDRIAEGWASL